MNPFFAFLTIYPGFGVTALIVPLLALRWFLAPAARKQTEWLFVAALLIEPAGIFSQFDAVFGSPSFHLGQIAAAHLWLRTLVSVSYGLLPMAMLGAFAATLLLRPEREAVRVAQTFLLNLFAALPIYLLFPVCGPAFAFPSFPALPPAGLVPHLLAISAAPNGIPSVHMSSALLVLWFLRRWNWGRALGGVYAALIVLATLASGQHYLFDLLCAVPYTVAVVWAVDRFAARSAASQHTETFLDQQLQGAAL
jgi:hypothetical protein